MKTNREAKHELEAGFAGVGGGAARNSQLIPAGARLASDTAAAHQTKGARSCAGSRWRPGAGNGLPLAAQQTGKDADERDSDPSPGVRVQAARSRHHNFGEKQL